MCDLWDVADDFPGCTIFFELVIWFDGVEIWRADVRFDIGPTLNWLEGAKDVEFVPVDVEFVVIVIVVEFGAAVFAVDDILIAEYPTVFFLCFGGVGFVTTFCLVDALLRPWSINKLAASCSTITSVRFPTNDDVDVELFIVEVVAGREIGCLKIFSAYETRYFCWGPIILPGRQILIHPIASWAVKRWFLIK